MAIFYRRNVYVVLYITLEVQLMIIFYKRFLEIQL